MFASDKLNKLFAHTQSITWISKGQSTSPFSRMLIKRGKKQKRKPEAPEKPGGKKRPRIRTRLRTDPNTGHPLVTGKLVNYLETVLLQKKLRLQNGEQKPPNEEQQQKPKAEQQQRPELARAVDIAVKAFEACVSRVGGGDAGSGRKKSKKSANDDDGSAADGEHQFVVNEEEVFDRVVQLCFRSLGKCLYVLLDPLEKPKKEGNNKFTGKKKKKNGDAINGKEPGKHTHFRHWHRYRLLAKRYLTAVHGFLVELHANEMIVPAIRAVSDLVDLYLHFPKLCKHLIKCLIQIWSRQGHSEEARCMAFAALCKCGRMDVKMFPLIYKGCYTAYVANCKLIDPETLPSVGFMQRSFQELAFLHPGIAYEYSFVYIRQFAIHLRNAMIAKRKDLIQTVYNWQFLKGLQLWTGLVCEGNRRFPTKSERQHFWYRELVHPLVECITIELRLFPSTKFLPLRIHCVHLLLTIQQGCSVFIPTLAYAIELLDELAEIDVKKPQAGKGSARDFELDRLLRLSREQLEDAGVRQLLAQQIHTLAQEALAVLNRSEPGYQLLLTPIAANLRRFLKTCANREHVRLFGQLMRAQMTPEGVGGPTTKHGGGGDGRGEGGEGGRREDEENEEKEGQPKRKMGKFDEKKVKKVEKMEKKMEK